ncbi:VanZ family protein [Williamwhitmania taraxaci]|uniref:VanZ like family protein n=1 Tax=Williamwhitmania taraxaci TaxID=1640674 RepID=A0A1G6GH67_9BACT|nr:VanZ family protein [Williamwhitmania taraxaci]SDB81337.1 VanZ like family protein [Williamwhitmania taraxaci]
MKLIIAKLDYIFWLWIGALFVGALIPGLGVGRVTIESFSFRADYLCHALAFFGIVAIFTMAQLNDIVIFKRFAWIKLILLCIVLGISIEVLQYFIPGRSFNLFDILSNLVGLSFGLLLFRVVALLRD